ncbi:hypothetical protein CRENBAI_011629 [Crenichthys baileyi]|uniref:Uncharacterized protein n=1 Tax=Crenichthys baileyi TaxID=28760 RepID=A0AAV9SIF9_9TELE
MVSVVIILMDNITKEVALVLAQVEASGLEWEQEECWDIFLVVRGHSRVAHLQLEKTTLLGHAKLQVLVEPKEDRSWKGGKVLLSGSQEQLSIFLSGSRTRVS